MPTNNGTHFEQRVFGILRRLVDEGLARDLRRQEYVVDRDANTRKIDLSLVLCTNLVDLLVSVECKKKGRSLSLDDVDQIKAFKRELPERNLFWLVFDGSINDSVKRALKNAGISAYCIEELERIVTDIVNTLHSSRGAIHRARAEVRRFSAMDTYMQLQAEGDLHRVIAGAFRPLDEVMQALIAEASPMHQQIEEMWAPPYAKFSDDELKPYLEAVNSTDPEGWLIRRLIDFKMSGGTEEDAEAILEWLILATGDGIDDRYDVICEVKDYVTGVCDSRHNYIFSPDFSEQNFRRNVPSEGLPVPDKAYAKGEDR